ncbi:protein kinase domain-containing protein [Subtercola vilae]|uniref:non-specific serine/threonine protein kinase n=1 Tax=Subtercola vilae TaxID=2056433 RepID=A0A4T2BTX5_9MICO|nr:protein kinase [Subtercola vilae]TIH34462.1 serine/threonine-protein kinase [Subtercola vilae]
MTSAPADPMIDRLIDGRYEVHSRIARGGMATVYVANDLRLDRRVAIKIMHGHLADDDAFRERFVQEARSAARLAHPNVVSVFDQGQDSEMAYMVMEYLPGMTLRDLLKDYGRLTTEQTLDIMEAVLGGLAAAHKAGIVHRDVKPENVLLADDGRIKIGDFGLARAASANTATGQALLGTIAYLSPELLTRGVADARSDIYATGIMMYEMLVGEQPYKGEQPMQIAFQHANETVPAPSIANPSIPPEVDELVTWATSRDPNERPYDARVMLDRLLEAEAVATASIRATAQMLRASALETAVLPKSMFEVNGVGAAAGAAGGGFDAASADAQGEDEGETQVLRRPAKVRRAERKRAAADAAGLASAAGIAGAAGFGAAAGAGSTRIAPGASQLAGTGVAGATGFAGGTGFAAMPAITGETTKFGSTGLIGSSERGGASGAPGAPGYPHDYDAGFDNNDGSGSNDGSGHGIAVATRPAGPVEKLAARSSKRRRRGWWIVALVLLIAAASGGTGWYFSSGPGGQLGVPSVAGLTPDQASAALTGVGLQVSQGSATNPTVPAGTVIGSDPSGGAMVLNGSNITVIVSTGPAQLPVPPNLVGQAEAAAGQAVKDAGFTLAPSQTEFSSKNDTGTVMQVLGADGQPLGPTYAEQRPVTFMVSLGSVPNTVGKSSADANAALVAAGLASSVATESYSETVPTGVVISYALPADPTPVGATVTLEVSKGPAPVPVPDVTSKSWSDAKAALQAAGFTLAYNGLADLAPSAFTVRATDPVAGTSLPRGSKITVSFSGF